MNLSEKTKAMLWKVFAVVIVITIAAWMILNPAPKHIEDTNGADNYALQTITEYDVVKHDMGTRGGPNTSEPLLMSGVKYSAFKFTGVQLMNSYHIFKGSDIVVDLMNFEIHSGNFAFYVVFDGEIVGEVKPDDTGMAMFEMRDVTKGGLVEYVIAGESAKFSFVATEEWTY